MDDKEKELLSQMKAALVFAQKMLLQAQQYTSKHCPDCMMNRYRTDCALAHIRTLCPLNENVFIDSATLDAINGKCREIEESSWGHQEKKCA
jgi:hypothetical protein